MHMLTMDQLLRRVVERKGYTVQGVDREALLARKEDETLLAAWRTDGEVTLGDAHAFLSAFEQVHASVGVLVAPRGIAPEAKTVVAQRAGIEVWTESRVVVEVGEAIVKDACERPPAGPVQLQRAASAPLPTPQPEAGQRPMARFPSLVATAASLVTGDRSGVATFVPNRPSSKVGGSQATIPQRGNVLGYAWGGEGGPTSNGVAQMMRSKPRVEISQTTVPTAPPVPSAIASNEDIELLPSKPRARPAPMADAPTLAQAVAAPAAATAVVEDDDYEIIGTKAVAPPTPPTSTAAPAGTTVAAQPREQAPPVETSGSCHVLRLKVTREHALSRARAKQGSTATLVLVPHVAFEYHVQMRRAGMPAPAEGRGAILASSVTGELRAVDGLDFAVAEPANARREPERLGAADVVERVRAHVQRAFAKTVNVEREIQGNTVSATERFVPTDDEMGLQQHDVVHVPVWEVLSGDDVLRVDAYTGDVLA